MASFQSETFTNDTVKLDGNEYRDCRFENCTIEYSGGTMPVIQNCHFHDLHVHLNGAAGNGLLFLHLCYLGLGQMGKDVVEGIFDQIRQKQ